MFTFPRHYGSARRGVAISNKRTRVWNEEQTDKIVQPPQKKQKRQTNQANDEKTSVRAGEKVYVVMEVLVDQGRQTPYKPREISVHINKDSANRKAEKLFISRHQESISIDDSNYDKRGFFNRECAEFIPNKVPKIGNHAPSYKYYVRAKKLEI